MLIKNNGNIDLMLPRTYLDYVHVVSLIPWFNEIQCAKSQITCKIYLFLFNNLTCFCSLIYLKMHVHSPHNNMLSKDEVITLLSSSCHYDARTHGSNNLTSSTKNTVVCIFF